MTTGLGVSLGLPVEEAETVLGHIKSRIEPNRLAELPDRLLRIACFLVDPAENIVHLGNTIDR